jgi:hypothetical protein
MHPGVPAGASAAGAKASEPHGFIVNSSAADVAIAAASGASNPLRRAMRSRINNLTLLRKSGNTQP